MPFCTIASPKLTYVGKVPKFIFENLRSKLVNFKAYFVRKVPKRRVFNKDWLRKTYFVKKVPKISVYNRE